MAKTKYKGELATPLSEHDFLKWLFSEETRSDELGDRARHVWLQLERLDRLLLLLDHYKIDRTSRSCWAQLSMALAIAHVPGFAVTSKRIGRPCQKNHLALMMQKKAPKRIGRPRQAYYGYPIIMIAALLDELNYLKVPKQKQLKTVLEYLRQKNGGYHDPRAVARALRRYKADKRIKKSN